MTLRNSICMVSKKSFPPLLPYSSSGARRWHGRAPTRSMATIVPPVTQDATSSKGPTAMVFMNMGGPATTDAVGNFLSRLFVSFSCLPSNRCLLTDLFRRLMPTLFLSGPFNPTLGLSLLVVERLKFKNNMLPSVEDRLSANGLNINPRKCARY